MMKNTLSAINFPPRKVGAGLAIALALGAFPVSAVAQPTTSQAPGQPLPPYAQPAAVPSYAAREEQIKGRIASITGKYSLQVRDDRGFVDTVTLHDGTIINPTGLRLAPGQTVTVVGHSAGKSFQANEIDTPYAHYGYAYGYGYPYYGYGYPFAFGVGFRGRGFGFGGWY